MSTEHAVRGWLAAVSRREPVCVDRSKQDGGYGRDRCDSEATDENVASASWQQQPRGACTEIGDGQDAAGYVVRTEERRIPSGALRRGLAGRSHGKQGKADRPQRLLSRRPSQ